MFLTLEQVQIVRILSPRSIMFLHFKSLVLSVSTLFLIIWSVHLHSNSSGLSFSPVSSSMLDRLLN